MIHEESQTTRIIEFIERNGPSTVRYIAMSLKIKTAHVRNLAKWMDELELTTEKDGEKLSKTDYIVSTIVDKN